MKEVKEAVSKLIEDLIYRTADARIIPDTHSATLGGRYVVNINGSVTDLITGLSVPSSGTKVKQHRLMQVDGSKNKQIGMTTHRAIALAFLGAESLKGKRVYIIENKAPLSLKNLYVTSKLYVQGLPMKLKGQLIEERGLQSYS